MPNARTRFYAASDLNSPAGCEYNDFSDFNFNAPQFSGWGISSHSAYNAESGSDGSWYPKIWSWYNTFLAGHGVPPNAFPPAIPIGEE
jgi:hypothetical protein